MGKKRNTPPKTTEELDEELITVILPIING